MEHTLDKTILSVTCVALSFNEYLPKTLTTDRFVNLEVGGAHINFKEDIIFFSSENLFVVNSALTFFQCECGTFDFFYLCDN